MNEQPTPRRITAVPWHPGVPPEEIPLIDLLRVDARIERQMAQLALNHVRCAIAELEMAGVLLGVAPEPSSGGSSS